MNTANRHVLKDWVAGAHLIDVNVVGAGREDLLAAVNASVALDPVSVSFCAVPDGSGPTQPLAVTLTSLRGVAVTYSLAVLGGDPNVSYSVSPSTIILPAGGSGVVNVTMSAVKGAALGLHQGLLTLSSGGTETAHAGILTLIK